ncbi:MAG: molecular chaperone TorD family protein [Rhodospirillaceae bacterium]|nr:molecular chaperone TorD family protein [Rhodospirillales bacterium]
MPVSEAAVVMATDEEHLRARFWGLLAALLAAPPSAPLLGTLALIPGDASELGHALADLAATARTMDPAAAEDEFNALFIGLSRGELVPFASYYLTGFLHEKPLAHLRANMEALGMVVNDNVSEPEDHIAILAEIMQLLIDGSLGAPLSLAEQKRFFAAHIEPWAGRFFTDLENSPAARLYRPVGVLGRLFLAVEAQAFAMID